MEGQLKKSSNEILEEMRKQKMKVTEQVKTDSVQKVRYKRLYTGSYKRLDTRG